LGTDLGTKLCETAPKRCNDVARVGHIRPADLHFLDKASREELAVRSS
jgi:hypothetical protein